MSAAKDAAGTKGPTLAEWHEKEAADNEFTQAVAFSPDEPGHAECGARAEFHRNAASTINAMVNALEDCSEWMVDSGECSCDASVNYECQKCGRIANAVRAVALARGAK